MHSSDGIAQSALGDLLVQMDLSPAETGGIVHITGADPVVPGRHRLGSAAASALAALGAGVAALWQARTGEEQAVTVDMRAAAVVGLRTNLYLRQNGYLLDHLPPGSGGPANFFRTRDGRWIFIHRSTVFPETLTRLLDFFSCSLSTAAMGAAVAMWDAFQLEEALAERQLIAAVARTRDEWVAHPHGAWLAAQPVISIERIGTSDPEPLGDRPSRPLTGVRVVDMTHVLAGPVASRSLAEHGADVVRVSSPHRPDPLPMVMDTGFGKRSAFADLDESSDRRRFEAFVADADVFVQSYRPGVMERRELGPQHLAAMRPGIVYVSISAYGDGGPWASRGGYEPLSQTACGLAIDEGSPDRPQFVSTRTLNDFLAAYLAAAGTCAALRRRLRYGGSYHVRVSLTGASMWVQRLGLLTDVAEGGDLPAPLPSDLMRTPTSFGTLEHAAPIVRLSKTPGAFALPPTVLGAGTLTWSARTQPSA